LGPLDPRPPLVHLREHLLHQVLRAVAVTGEQVGEAEQRRPAVDDELVEAVLHGSPPPCCQTRTGPGGLLLVRPSGSVGRIRGVAEWIRSVVEAWGPAGVGLLIALETILP